MASTIKLKNGTGGAPSSLAQGEVALSTSTGIFYFGDGSAVNELHRFNNISASGHITASGHISASGTVFATDYKGQWRGTAISSTYIEADAITGAKIADNAIDSEHYTDGSIDNAHIADDAIDSEHYADGSIDNAHIADDAIDSEHYADGSIDTAHIADAQVTVAKMANLADMKVLGNVSGGTTAPAAVTILDEDAMGTNSATSLATQQSIKAYADRPAKHIQIMTAGFLRNFSSSVSKFYIPLYSNLENATATNEKNGFVAPYNGKLLKLMHRTSGNFSTKTVDFTLETISRNAAFSSTINVLETVQVAGPTNSNGDDDPNMVVANFVGGSGTNAFTAGDHVMIGIEYNATHGSSVAKYFFTLVFEFDVSGEA